jgi:hypothetical protein
MASNLRQKRQEDDAETDDQSADELCENRPPDEYFRLSTEGDCRDVVRYNEYCKQQAAMQYGFILTVEVSQIRKTEVAKPQLIH